MQSAAANSHPVKNGGLFAVVAEGAETVAPVQNKFSPLSQKGNPYTMRMDMLPQGQRGIRDAEVLNWRLTVEVAHKQAPTRPYITITCDAFRLSKARGDAVWTELTGERMKATRFIVKGLLMYDLCKLYWLQGDSKDSWEVKAALADDVIGRVFSGEFAAAATLGQWEHLTGGERKKQLLYAAVHVLFWFMNEFKVLQHPPHAIKQMAWTCGTCGAEAHHKSDACSLCMAPRTGASRTHLEDMKRLADARRDSTAAPEEEVPLASSDGAHIDWTAVPHLYKRFRELMDEGKMVKPASQR